MRYFRFFTLFLCLCILGGWFLLAKRTVLLEQAISHQLEAIGATNIELAITGISLSSFTVSSLHASFPDNSPLQSLSLQNLVLNFKARELFRGSISKLSIDTLTVALALLDTQEKSSTPLPLEKIRSFIPEKVVIKELRISTPLLNNDLLLQITISNKTNKPLALWTAFSVKNLPLKTLDVNGLQGELFIQTEDARSISINKSSYITVDRVGNGTTSIEKSRLQFSAQLSKNADNAGWKIHDTNIDINTQEIHLQKIFLQPAPLAIEMAVRSDPFQANVSLKSDTLFLQFEDKSLALSNIQLQLNSNGSNHKLDFQFSHATIPGRLAVEISHNSQNGSGKALFSTSLPFDLRSEATNLSQVINGLNLPLDVSAGLVNSKGKINWSKNTLQNVQSSFSLRNGAGSYGNTTFTGLLLQQDLELFPKISTRSPGYLSVAEISNGLTLRNFALRNQLLASDDSSLPLLLLDSIQTELLGGIVSSRGIQVDLQEQELDCIIHLDRMDLEKIVQLNKLNGLHVSGILDGTIHAQWKDRQLNISKGELHSRAPGGTISYLPPGGSDGFSTLPAYALKALEEFNYDTLIATPTYKSDGTLTINIKTEGHSPPLKSSRPVHLNLNTEQNILSLLQSLRYSKNLTDELEQRLRIKPLKN